MEEADIEFALEAMRKQLIKKNVAIGIADEICESVSAKLISQKLGSFTRVQTVVQKAVEESVLRILTPKKSIDVLRSVMEVWNVP